MQARREHDGVNFTGHHDLSKATCPAELARPVETIERWYGNVPVTAAMIEERDRQHEAMMAELRQKYPGALE